MALLNWLASAWSRWSKANRTTQNVARYREPFYRFQSAAEVQQAAQIGVTIDVNQATVDDWLRLPGISIHQARALTDLSRSGVRFYSLEDLAAALGVGVDRLAYIKPILRFYYYEDDPQEGLAPVEVNRASIEMLAQVPGIDLYLARTIVQYRQSGPYENLADLQRRLCLPPDLTTNLLHYLKFSER